MTGAKPGSAAEDLRRRFDALVDMHPEQRRAALEREALEDAERAGRLAALLRAHEQDDERLQTGRLSGALSAALPEPQALIDRELGGYRLIECIGRGGMGLVFRGERVREGVTQTAAIKLLSAGMFEGLGEAGFLREAGLLARLDHPGICRLRDFGRTDEGWSYLVLDLVEGEAIDRVAARLPRRRRVTLMLRVAEAVAAAHRQLVVHLDLKPANVLVRGDERPVLLDFGIAQALGESVAGSPAVAVWLTPDYASPEQLRGEPASVAADVYALGCMLFEIVYQRHPFAPAAATTEARLDAVRRGPAAVPRWRAGPSSDLAAICARALAFDPAARYATVDALADDLRSLLATRPVKAVPDSLGYRLRRWLQRNPVASASALAAVAALATLAVSLVMQSESLRQQRDRAEREAGRAQLAIELLLSSIRAANPSGSGGVDLTVAELLDQTIPRVDQRLAGTPLIRAAALVEIARVRRALGQDSEALALFETAENLLEAREDEDGQRLHLAARVGRVETLRSLSRVDDALALAHASLPLADAAHAWRLHLVLGNGLLAQDRQPEAKAHFQVGLATVPASEAGHRASMLAGLAFIESSQDRHAEALALIDEARRGLPQLPEHRAMLGRLLGDASFSLARLSRFDEADAAVNEALSIRRSIHGEIHPAVVITLIDRVSVLTMAGRPDRALAVAQEAEAIERQLGDGRSRRMERLLASMGALQRELGQLEPARDTLREALQLAEALLPEQHRSAANTRNNLANVLADLGQHEEAIELLQVSWRIYREGSSDGPSRGAALAAANLADSLLSLGRSDEALHWAELAWQDAEPSIEAHDWYRARVLQVLASAQLAAGHRDRARGTADEAKAALSAASAEPPESMRQSMQALRAVLESRSSTATH